MKREFPEYEIQQAIVVHFERTYEGEIAHVANGGRRHFAEALRFKRLGVKAGHPDLVVYTPGARTYLLEVKADAGSLSRKQESFIDRLRGLSYDVATVHSLDEAKRAFEAWGLPRKQPRGRSEAELRTGF